MSMNIYLDQKKVKEHPSFRPDRGSVIFAGRLMDVSIYREMSGYSIRGQLDDIWPEELLDMVTAVTMREDFFNHPERARGKYEDGDTVAFLDHFTDSKPSNFAVMQCKVTITGPTPEKVIALYTKIRAGKISPKESWENPHARQEAHWTNRFFRLLGRVASPHGR